MRHLRRRTGAACPRPHTVYAKSLCRISGQDYCQHDIIGAAVAAGVITEVRSGGALGASASLRE